MCAIDKIYSFATYIIVGEYQVLMFRKLSIISLLLLSTAASLYASSKRVDEGGVDTTIYAREVVISAQSLKQQRPLITAPVSASVLNQEAVEELMVDAPKELTAIVPNLYAPDYGSRMTSSIYIRGLGARIDQPVMGLNIDNVPIMNKDAYDLELADIERIEVLRGPQSTLYGRNTMGGVMNIKTLSPLSYEGARFMGEYSSGNSYKARAASYFKVRDDFGVSVAGNYFHSDGLFTNDYTSELCDNEQGGGGRIKLEWQSDDWWVGNTTSFSILNQGGYPYRSLSEGDINYNDPCSYERTALTTAVTARHSMERVQFENNLSYQLLDDCMTLDQDFRPKSYFTLVQDRREHAFTEEFVIRGSRQRYDWLAGAFAFIKHSNMAAPVTFLEDGLQELIIDNVREHTSVEPIFFDNDFPLLSDFDTNTYGAALYHQSNIELGRWLLSAGLRVDLEWATMDYLSRTTEPCQILSNYIDPYAIGGRLKNSSFELLPNFSALYRVGKNRLSTLYVSISKGFKAGGFNTQMFSEVLQNSLMNKMGASWGKYNIEDIVSYSPEQSWNYEVGGHLHAAKGDLKLDWTLFFIDCRDQQLTIFPEGQTTGRMMTNAGRTHSYGAELSFVARPVRNLNIMGSYGYTHATFSHYKSGNNDYAGKRVPYSPEHTISLRASYDIEVGAKWLETLKPIVDFVVAGSIFWNEENSRRQELYSLLNFTLRVEHKNYSIDVWCRNIADTNYDTFYFKSIEREFVQQGRPRTFGITLNINIL